MNTRAYSRAQEESIAKALGGKIVANSGATAFNKGDVIINDGVSKIMLIEAKTVTKEQSSFSIKKAWIEKNKNEAFSLRIGLTAIAFSFGDGKNYYVIDERLMQRLIRSIKEEN